MLKKLHVIRLIATLFVIAIFSGPLPANSQTTGSVSGTVTESGTLTPLKNALVTAYPLEQTGSLGLGMTDEKGIYSITDLVEGNYYVEANVHSQNYIGEYYDNTIFRTYADMVVVSAGKDTPNIDFELAQGGMISGRVVDGKGIGIDGVFIYAYFDCNLYELTYSKTNAAGVYTLLGLPATTVFLRAESSPSNSVSYVSEWYGDAALCEDASVVTVNTGLTTEDIDFQLELAGSISGTVFKSDGITPVADMPVYIYSDPCEGPALITTFTDEAGEYFRGTLAPGDVYVKIVTEFAPDHDLSENFLRQWYESALSCEEANSIQIEAGIEESEINFSLYDSVDSDEDGMPDNWEIFYFGDVSRDGNSDFDGDGIIDIEEYEADFNPNSKRNTAGDSIVEDPPLNEIESESQSDSQGISSGDGGGCFISTIADSTSKEYVESLPLFSVIASCFLSWF